MKFVHKPVMLQECISMLNVVAYGTYVDCTAGGGGHSEAILSLLDTNGRLIDIDKDDEALLACKNRFANMPNKNINYVKSDYKCFENVLDELKIDKVNGVLVDLGVSSYQIDNPDRGFSYMTADSPLDMRMNQSQALSAKDVVNSYEYDRLCKILYDYGEEEFAKTIAKNIVERRQIKPIETCGQLVEIVDGSIPNAIKCKRGHCAKKTFQALRIEVNGELDGLEQALRSFISRLKSGGRLAVITFHSLEDRIVKKCFADCATDCICPPSAPICICNHRALGTLVNKKPIVASQSEIDNNSRCKSAKLRVFERK
ncbi:MAG: 16S rRNA (cytosine(1402)-N(4))-methyltransferase RsmH [Corallococcus sp.]|nr:16S rRNA (cytosine(1402)-N(4))-methyltransferase RsmH [Corallococcus sp.]